MQYMYRNMLMKTGHHGDEHMEPLVREDLEVDDHAKADSMAEKHIWSCVGSMSNISLHIRLCKASVTLFQAYGSSGYPLYHPSGEIATRWSGLG